MLAQSHSANVTASAIAAAEVGNSMRDQWHRQLAEDNGIGCLLNCYIREYAQPHAQVCLKDESADRPLALSHGILAGERKVRIRFPESGAVLLLVADRISLLGRCRFIGQPYLKRKGHCWQLMEALALAQFLLGHLARVTDTEFNHELLAQIGNSMEVTKAFVQRLDLDEAIPGADGAPSGQVGAQASLIVSEQSLLWGHAMHPAPKSRHGVAFDDMLACSPEIQANFPLYWFEVDAGLVKQLRCTQVLPLTLLEQASQTQAPSGRCLYPCHPWEVQTILAQPLVQAAIAAGRMTPIGNLGAEVYPTSSVRTTYLPEINQFLKFSIHVRLTNCVRKNAWYELESAVALSRLLLAATGDAYFHCPKFALMAEPAASTLDLCDLAPNAEEDAAAIMVAECFGILYRDGIAPELQAKYRPQMAGALFAWDMRGQSLCGQAVARLARQRQQSYGQTALTWFDAYLDALLPGVFYYFFKLGVAFEPHLQNTVIGFDAGLPAFVWIRDLEGTKLVPEHWPAERLSGWSAKAKASVYYSREQGWQRIGYCTLINNVSEAIFHLAGGDEALEASLWQRLAKAIAQWQLLQGEQPELMGVLRGDDIPSKNNLTTRLLKQADRLSGYTQLANPLALSPVAA
ncbi:hypothetical protein LZP73_11745 [Shewanella sp. AS16]|uniref:IucA/IucC family protein n=1 Tax=Shewanella sp. AS16 TaxID=2907625 RepID=UPI001F454FC5|nr:IucA/IucC family protein [Shewanella sp. AS16]MCE9686865.1 hypothetical protein [Shewanella sp. AS16]